MSRKKRVTIYLLSALLTTLTALTTSPYLIGSYVYNKNTWNSNVTDSLCTYLKKAGFNTAVSTAVHDMEYTNTQSFIARMSSQNIDCMLEDYIFNIDAFQYGARTLSMGNHLRFEAEYHDASDVNQGDALSDSMFYMSPSADSMRVGYQISAESFSNRYYWEIDNGCEGYAYRDMIYRWPIGGSSNYHRVGQEFRFPMHGTGSYALVNSNNLHITYALKCDLPDNLPSTAVIAEISLTYKGLTTDSTQCHLIKHYTTIQDSTDTTLVTKAMYDAAPVIDITTGLKAISIFAPVKSLIYHGTTQGLHYWDRQLKNLNPNLYWRGEGVLKLDYIEFEDDLYRNYSSNNTVLSQIRFSDQKYLYGYDEPGQGQFAACNSISKKFESTGNAPLFITAVHDFQSDALKSNGNSYRHQKSYLETVDPEVLLLDIYPLNPARSKNVDWSDTTDAKFIQKSIDIVCDTYQYYRTLCADSILFMCAPQTYGTWDMSESQWSYLLPPDKLAMCLQYLPLCYQASGILSYQLYSNSKKTWGLIHGSENYEIFFPSNQYYAIKEANAKIALYGKMLLDMNWHGSGRIMTDGIIGADTTSVLLNDLKIPAITNPQLYQGYVQSGFYTDHDNLPYIMLVNRRTTVSNITLGEIAPDEYLTAYNASYQSAPPQNVSFTASNSAEQVLGTYIGLYDMYDSNLFRSTTPQILVPIGPGDGILLQMVSTLPYSVTSDAVLKHTGYLDGDITIQPNVEVDFVAGSDITFLANTHLTISTNSTLFINGSVELQNGAQITNHGDIYIAGESLKFLEECTLTNFGNIYIDGIAWDVMTGSEIVNHGLMEISNAQLSLSSDTSILNTTPSGCVNLGQMTIDNSILNNPDGNWIGIIARNADKLQISNSTISNALCGVYTTNTNLTVSDTRFDIPLMTENGMTYGVHVYNTNSGKTIKVLADTTYYGFYGQSNGFCNGIFVNGPADTLTIGNLGFYNLHYGVKIMNSFTPQDSIVGCSFNNCFTGLKVFTGFRSGRIRECTFSQNDLGIDMINTAPRVDGCIFNNCVVTGIKAEMSTFTKSPGVFDCQFNSCTNGVESRYSSIDMAHNQFSRNEIGLLCHAGSNLNLSSEAENLFVNDLFNVFFTETNPYCAYLQLHKGHNDFYHFTDTTQNTTAYDFSFDSNYLEGYPAVPIDANGNWFQDGVYRIPADQNQNYVTCENFDPAPNQPSPDPENNRFFMALELEDNQNYSSAISTYKDILQNPTTAEMMYLGSCADGVYRLSELAGYPVEQYVAYFDSTAVQYAVGNPYLSNLLKLYQVQKLIIAKEFQDAVDIVQDRIDNPVSQLDSLRAVLDLEIILQLSEFESAKKPVSTRYVQYKYADIATFDRMHANHWNEMKDILNENNENIIPIPPVATLYQNYPNPFNLNTTIRFAIPEKSQVEIRIYNLKGQLVRNLCKGEYRKGHHKSTWDGKDTHGKQTGSGMYLVRMQAKGSNQTKKIMLLK
jgi:hypothetical protein